MSHFTSILQLLYFIYFLIVCEHTAAAPKLDDYPISKKIWIGTEKVLITFEDEYRASSPSKAQVTLHVLDFAVSKDTHWATINLEDLKHEQKLYEVEERKTKRQIDALKDESIKELIAIEAELSEIEENIFNLEIAKELDEIQTATRNKIISAIQKLKKDQARLQEKIDSEDHIALKELKQEELELNLESKRRALERLENQSQLIAPFAGLLELNLPQEEVDKLKKGESIWIDANKNFAQIINKKELTVKIPPTSVTLQGVTAKNVNLSIPYGTQGLTASAHFKEKKMSFNVIQPQEEWVFQITNQHSDELHRLVNRPLISNVFLTLPQNSYVIPKKDLIHLHPEILEKYGWRGLVSKLWSNVRIIRSGPTSIAVQKMDS